MKIERSITYLKEEFYESIQTKMEERIDSRQ